MAASRPPNLPPHAGAGTRLIKLYRHSEQTKGPGPFGS